MVLGDRRIVDDIASREMNAATKILFAAIDAHQYRACRQDLEGAAHREAFVHAMAEAMPGRGIDHRDTQSAAGLFFDRGKWVGDIRRGNPAVGPAGDGRGEKGRSRKRAACKHDHGSHIKITRATVEAARAVNVDAR
jgi:hypothetical protein